MKKLNETDIYSIITSEEKYTYDMLGRKTSYVNREGTVVKYSYDKMGNVISEAVYDGSEKVKEKAYAYSNDNLLISETDGNGDTTTYEYDKAVRQRDGSPVLTLQDNRTVPLSPEGG